MDAAYWAGEVDYLRTDETAGKTYLPGDRAPKMGEVFRNAELAWSLEQIAQHGRAAFYKGEIAAKILESMKAQRSDGHAGFVRILQRICRADFHYLSRLDCLRAAAQRGRVSRHWKCSTSWKLFTRAEGLGIRLDESVPWHDRAKKLAYADWPITSATEETKLPVATLAFDRVGGQRQVGQPLSSSRIPSPSA